MRYHAGGIIAKCRVQSAKWGCEGGENDKAMTNDKAQVMTLR